MTRAAAIEISGIGRDRTLRGRVTKQLAAALVPLRVTPVAARVDFVDDNGPKGGMGMRCAVTVRLPYRPALRAERVAETARLAFDGAHAALERLLERYRERDRDSRRRPKKYYAAARLVAPAVAERPRSRARTRG